MFHHLFGRPRRRVSLGLDVGRRALKVVRCDRGRVVARSLVPWQPPERCDDPQAAGVLAAAVGRAVAPLGTRRGETVACVLSLGFGSFRGLELPASSSDDELLEMVRQEFATDASFDPDRAEVACWRTPGGGDLQPAGGWALAHDTSRYVANELARAGLVCALIDALPFALARAAAAIGEGVDDEPVAIVDCGSHAPSLVIARRGRPLFTRLLRGCGHARVVERLGEGLGLSEPEAWAYLEFFSEPAAGSAEPRQLLQEFAREPVGGLVAEVERTLDFLEERVPNLVPGSVLLVGGAAELAAEPLRAAFGERVRTWSEPVASRAGSGVGAGASAAFGAAIAVASLELAP